MAQCVDMQYVKGTYLPSPENDKAGKSYRKYGYYVPCGKCYQCLAARRSAWIFRLKKHLEDPGVNGCCFMTITRTDEHNERMNYELNKTELQSLIKKVRNSGCEFDYFAIGEYGSNTHRPHYHLLLYSKNETNLEFLVKQFNYYYADFKRDKHSWIRGESHGGIVAAEVLPRRIGYITHYHIQPKEHPTDKLKAKPFQIQSQGLGASYIESPEVLAFVNQRKDFLIRDLGGNTIPLPRYYRKKHGLEKADNQYFVEPWFGDRDLYRKNLKNNIIFEEKRRLITASKNKLKNYNKQQKINNL